MGSKPEMFSHFLLLNILCFLQLVRTAVVPLPYVNQQPSTQLKNLRTLAPWISYQASSQIKTNLISKSPNKLGKEVWRCGWEDLCRKQLSQISRLNSRMAHL